MSLQEYAAKVRVANTVDSVFRDECMYSFDSPFSEGGLYTNLISLESVGEPFLQLDQKKTPNAIYLHQEFEKIKITPHKDSEENIRTKLAIGGQGGFSDGAEGNQFEVAKRFAIVVLEPNSGKESVRIEYPSEKIPPAINDAVEALLNHAGNIVQETVATWQEELKETKYADNLVQLPNPPKLSANSQTWKCQADDCDMRENLWLNLSDGFIGCGRKNWDGSGGCGGALKHYEQTGKKYPLAVKLGTITAKEGDVFSYPPDEDELVINKYLSSHLAHFGINIQNLKKTDKSMNELQVGLNMSYDFDAITEKGKKLIPISGGGHIGFTNLGNSCYINSVLQLLLALPEIQSRYFDAAHNIFITSMVPSEDFAVQMAKVATAILSERYKRNVSIEDGEKDLKGIDIRPSTFRALVGRGHASFSTQEQQDAVEYLQHLLDFMKRSEHVTKSRIGPLFPDQPNSKLLASAALFQFSFADRIECLQSHKVRYHTRDDLILRLQIPVECATNAPEVREYQENNTKRQRVVDGKVDDQAADTSRVVPDVPFDACLDRTFSSELIEDFLSSATGTKGSAQQTVRLKTFPRYLLLQMARFYAAEDWTPKKLEVSVRVPEQLSLQKYCSRGLQEGEDLLPESATTASSQNQNITPDENLVAQLVSMGFSENGCKKAVIATSNGSAEAAMEWILTHMEDDNFNDDMTMTTQGHKDEEISVEHLGTLTSLGFSENQADVALKMTSNDPDRAAEWLFSHMDDLDAAVAKYQVPDSVSVPNDAEQKERLDDSSCGDYTLVGFISHIGKNSNSGHYVCHLKKQGRWIIFNDDNVALSEEPPFSSGFLYLFRRNDCSPPASK
uniref:Ubiquitin carboxyl-terminal hydrolase n=1 Tax=Albugo laibachii Nc14 TaxID=890382 RepID=F0WK97_9STRA|nr:ubiquitin carboxylterminal hydrolase putative [Albugo laibachii Nc14]CCA21876.1 ubiquitin carboxylterminal hydrolase putative [Albugo laibachii Nc14]|eukprot:CCA21876.1 ubiquitin carboxylterminal hydrolase putative [Albugo laibachii Nc14]